MLRERSTITAIILETFRLNGALLLAGDRLVRDIGLTSARWQVLGAVDMSAVPLPVAHIARTMGLSRQAVQRVANDLVAEGLARFDANPHHARARLLVLTPAGRDAIAAATRRQKPWALGLARGIDAAELATALHVLHRLRTRLEAAGVPAKEDRHDPAKQPRPLRHRGRRAALDKRSADPRPDGRRHARREHR